MVKVGLKYCGSCNPRIDLSRLGGHLAALAPSLGFALVPAGEGEVIVVLNGCPTACGETALEVFRSPCRLIVTGGSLNGELVPEKFLPQALEQALRHCLEQRASVPAV